MPAITTARDEQLARLVQWYEQEYLPWFQAYGRDFGDFEVWKARRLDTWRWPLSQPGALWPPRQHP